MHKILSARAAAIWTIATIVALLAGSAALTGVASAAAAASGGTFTVLENTGYIGSWNGLDPATSTTGLANIPMMDAIYGDLFEWGTNNQPVPDLATGYKFADGGRTVIINLRKGVTFTDGTPFNAAAVKYNFTRDLSTASGNACECAENFPIGSVTTPNSLTVVLHLTKVFAPIMTSFITGGALNWIVSPTALAKMGETAFAQMPVGAGPFTVSSDKPNSSLDLVANPHYWQTGYPKVAALDFTTIGSDESAYEALQAGQADAYQRYQTYGSVAQIRKILQVSAIPPTQAGVIQLNTKKGVLSNKVAREALYWATNSAAINKSLIYGLGTVTQSPSGPGGLFYEPIVPGYRSYNLAKATAAVKQLGGLSVTISTVSTPYDSQLAVALKSEWAAAGINTTVSVIDVATAIKEYRAGSWQVGLPVAGGVDPGSALPNTYSSVSPLTGVSDPKLDALMNQGVGTLVASKRAAIYKQVFQYISSQAYSPFTPVAPVFDLAVKGVVGPGLTTNAPQIWWQDVTK